MKHFFWTLFICFSCSNNNHQEDNSSSAEPKYYQEDSSSSTGSKYYKDIYYYKLEGIDEIKYLLYPCIEIFEDGNHKTVTNHVEEGFDISRKYDKTDAGWVSKYEYKGDTVNRIIAYEFIEDGKSIVFSYTDSIKNNLIDLEVMEENKRRIYHLPRGSVVLPSPRNLDSLISESIEVYSSELTKHDSIMTERVVKTRNGKIIFSQSSCFENINASYYWRIWFGWRYLKEVECN